MLAMFMIPVLLILPTMSFAQNKCKWALLSAPEGQRSRPKRNDLASRSAHPESRIVKGVTDQQIAEGFPELAAEDAYYGLAAANRLMVQIKRTDSWGAPKDFAGKGIEVSIPVKNRAQGNAVLRYLLGPIGIDPAVLTTNPERRGANLAKGIFVQFKYPQETAGNIEPYMQIVLTNQMSHSIEAGELIIRALMDKGLYKKRAEEVEFDMTTNTGRHEWAIRTFQDNRDLTNEEFRALHDIGVSDYRTINGSLRRGDSMPDPRVPFVDSAIAKGKTDRAIKMFRSVYREDLMQLWSEMTKQPPANTEITPDPAYLFGSLDPAVARWWQHSWNDRKDGVILEIELPVGTHAAYLDARIHDRRGYMEMLLPRNVKLTALSAVSEEGYRVLRVKLHN